MPPETAAFLRLQLLAFLSVFAVLVCDTAAGLASGLARGLAFAAAAVLCALAEVAGVQSFDMFHTVTFYPKILDYTLAYPANRVNERRGFLPIFRRNLMPIIFRFA